MLFQISEAAVHRCSSQQVFLKISQYLQENNFIKTRLQRRCFPVNLAKFSKAVFYRTLPVAVSGIYLQYLRLKDCARLVFGYPSMRFFIGIFSCIRSSSRTCLHQSIVASLCITDRLFQISNNTSYTLFSVSIETDKRCSAMFFPLFNRRFLYKD